jgi:hypothetical protein
MGGAAAARPPPSARPGTLVAVSFVPGDASSERLVCQALLEYMHFCLLTF